MKKQHFYLCLLASMLGMMTTGCSDETTQTDTPTAPDEDGRITVTASAGMPQGGASTRLGFEEADDKLLITWKDANETFSVLGGTESATPSLFTQTAVGDDKHSASFTGQINADESTTYYAVYPEITGNTAVAATSIPLDMTGQTGTALDEKKTYMYATSKYDATNNALTFNFNHLTSILKVTLKFILPVNASGTVHDMIKQELTRAATNETAGEVTFTADGLMSKASVDITRTPTDGTLPADAYTPEESGTLSLSGTFTLTNSGSNVYSTTVYLHVLPGTLNNLEVKAKVNGTEYSCKLSDQTTLEAGKMYTVSDAKMESPTFTVDTKIDTYGVSYDYNGLEMQFGTNEKTTATSTATITNGQATFSDDLSKYVGQTIWVCIPKVVKFFHEVTQDEADKGTLELPDKDKGSTLLKDDKYKAGENYYKNNWIVALYIGINKDGSEDANATPIYWATGNLIAIKTNDAGNNTNTSFHISTTEEYQNNTAITLPEGIKENDTDGYTQCAIGSQWDRFGWGDATGLMTTTDNTKYASDITDNDTGTTTNPVWKTISTTKYDIARQNLGGSWRLPAGGSNDNNGKGELRKLIENANFDKTNGTYTYTEGDIQNTLHFPATGDRNGIEPNNETAGCYWSGVAKIPENQTDGTQKWRARGFYLKDNGNLGNGENGFTRKSGRAIRPVTE